MSPELYEIVAQGARYWFLFLMALIVWRSYRWLGKDRRQRRKRVRLLPDAGFVGEMVVVRGSDRLSRGDTLPVPVEGSLGYSRANDLCVPAVGVAKRHCWLCYDQETGLLVEPCYGCRVTVDGQERTGRRDPLSMAHGSRLTVGEAELRLRLFAGYETKTGAQERKWEDEGDQPQAQPAAMTPEQFALWQRQQALWQYQQQALYQQQYAQWLAAQLDAEAEDGAGDDDGYGDGYGDGDDDQPSDSGDALPDEGADSANSLPSRQTDDPPDDQPYAASGQAPMADAYVPPAASSQIEFTHFQPIYPPVPGEPAPDDPWQDAPSLPGDSAPSWPDASPSADEDMTDAAAPPKSAYVGRDEAEAAKRLFWDKYLGGGDRR